MLKSRYYTEIDEVSLRNYRKAMDGKLEYLRKDQSVGTKKEDLKAWQLVYDDYLNEFGLGDRYEYYLELQMELVELNCEFVETGERFLLNRVEQIKAELKSFETVEDSDSLDDAITYVSKWIGSVINEREISAKSFFKMMSSMIKEQRKNIKHGKEDQF